MDVSKVIDRVAGGKTSKLQRPVTIKLRRDRGLHDKWVVAAEMEILYGDSLRDVNNEAKQAGTIMVKIYHDLRGKVEDLKVNDWIFDNGYFVMTITFTADEGHGLLPGSISEILSAYNIF